MLGCKEAQTSKEAPQQENVAQVKSPDERWGALFDTVQMARIFPDGKTFVDCTPREDDAVILAAFEKERTALGFDLATFVDKYFVRPGSPTDGYHSDSTEAVEAHITELWDLLTRKPDQYDPRSTLLPLPKSYVVPGGRFREVYYWDSYFTMLGLMADGRRDLVENMADNFAHLIKTYGHIPNGNRSYYLSRSQPPFFAAMIQLLAKDKPAEVYQKYLPALQGEYNFWMDGADKLTAEAPAHRRVVRMPDGSILNRYYDDRDVPRPESWREDKETAAKSGRNPAEVYRHLRAGAESGWDFSSRWLSDAKNLHTIHTTDIIPPDLNALMYNLEKALAEGYKVTGDEANAAKYAQAAEKRRDAVQQYCWDDRDGIFRDYDWLTKKQTPVASLATVYPLFFGFGDTKRVAAYVERNFLRDGGLLTTNNYIGQQWDAPNAWPPHQYMAIVAFKNLPLGPKIKERWVALHRKVYRQTGKMLEKYNVEDLSKPAGGGEYPVQDGFGWTNGVFQYLAKSQIVAD